MKQSTWEVWFIASVLLFSAVFFVGTVEGSREVFPNYVWALGSSVINLAVCFYYGSKQDK
jgi:hypothetical protein